MSGEPPASPWGPLTSSDPAFLRANLRAAISQFRSLPLEELGAWTSAAIGAWATTDNMETIEFVFGEFVDEFLKWLFEDVEARLDGIIHFVAVALDSPHRMAFLGVFAKVIPGLFPDKGNIDINLLLALQCPIFSYSVARQPDSGAVCEVWFHALARSRGVEIFGDNLQAAMSYFKLMNHAFFQASVTTTNGAKQEPMFVAAQDAMKQAIVAISRSMDT